MRVFLSQRVVNLKSTILTLFTVFIFVGCGGNQPLPIAEDNGMNHNQNMKSVKKVEAKEEYERTISYQDIITKINDINTKKKENQRIKEIVKEYKYNTSDDDSKNSAREKALNQVKIIILEEIGVFVESYLELNKIVTDEKYHKQFKQEIKNLTAGIIKTKILDEKYDGKTYFVKASVLVDPDSVSEGISEILKIKANQSEIKKLNALLSSKENEIDMRSQETIALQKKITNQEFLNMAKEEELKTIQFQLQQAQAKLHKYAIEEQRLQGELGQIQQKVNQAIQRIQSKSQKACMMSLGMTESEVKNALGSPDGSDTFCNQELRSDCDTKLVYGRVSLYFDGKTRILRAGLGCN